jgi:hypothetical protein
MRSFRVTIIAVEKQLLLHILDVFVALGTVFQIFVKFDLVVLYKRGTRWRSWFRHFATIRKVTGSIPD